MGVWEQDVFRSGYHRVEQYHHHPRWRGQLGTASVPVFTSTSTDAIPNPGPDRDTNPDSNANPCTDGNPYAHAHTNTYSYTNGISHINTYAKPNT